MRVCGRHGCARKIFPSTCPPHASRATEEYISAGDVNRVREGERESCRRRQSSLEFVIVLPTRPFTSTFVDSRFPGDHRRESGGVMECGPGELVFASHECCSVAKHSHDAGEKAIEHHPLPFAGKLAAGLRR
jgi:hypothetical protein